MPPAEFPRTRSIQHRRKVLCGISLVSAWRSLAIRSRKPFSRSTDSPSTQESSNILFARSTSGGLSPWSRLNARSSRSSGQVTIMCSVFSTRSAQLKYFSKSMLPSASNQFMSSNSFGIGLSSAMLHRARTPLANSSKLTKPLASKSKASKFCLCFQISAMGRPNLFATRLIPSNSASGMPDSLKSACVPRKNLKVAGTERSVTTCFAPQS
mmetsp:Transcript_68413/g.132128  ORF Transcript_68413/g.132128 Transcript_68413/m.132128 type:complete len:211 (-) Transcript_68413:239-871(-)